MNVDSFIGMVRKYTDITELTAEIIRSFVEKIVVMKPEKVPGTWTKKQTVMIYRNFIGAVDRALPPSPVDCCNPQCLKHTDVHCGRF